MKPCTHPDDHVVIGRGYGTNVVFQWCQLCGALREGHGPWRFPQDPQTLVLVGDLIDVIRALQIAGREANEVVKACTMALDLQAKTYETWTRTLERQGDAVNELIALAKGARRDRLQ